MENTTPTPWSVMKWWSSTTPNCCEVKPSLSSDSSGIEEVVLRATSLDHKQGKTPDSSTSTVSRVSHCYSLKLESCLSVPSCSVLERLGFCYCNNPWKTIFIHLSLSEVFLFFTLFIFGQIPQCLLPLWCQANWVYLEHSLDWLGSNLDRLHTKTLC